LSLPFALYFLCSCLTTDVASVVSFIIQHITKLLSIYHKSGKFYCIMYRIDKTMLLLVVATWQFGCYKKFSC